MEQSSQPFGLRLSEGLGPNALAYARERVSLLGAGEHMDTLDRALDALDGLPGAALLGGWTFKGFTAWAQQLEAERDLAISAVKRAVPAMREYAAKNPIHHFGETPQDPNGVHAWLRDFGA